MVGKLTLEGLDPEIITVTDRENLIKYMLQLEGYDVGVVLPKKGTIKLDVDPMQALMKMMMEERVERLEAEKQKRKLEETRQEEERKERENAIAREDTWRKAEYDFKREQLKISQEMMQRKENEAQEREERKEQEKQEMLERKEQEAREREERREREKQEEQQKKPVRLRLASKKLEKILPKMSSEINDIPMYFRIVENYFEEFEIDNDLKIALLLPNLTEKARRVITRLSTEQRENYEEVKHQILREFKMTPRGYRTQFIETVKENGETWTQFASRLDNIFTYYVEGREVTTLKQLQQLMVADKMKDAMYYKLKEYILSKEGDGWLTPRGLAEAADVYIANVGEYHGGARNRKAQYETPGDKAENNSFAQNWNTPGKDKSAEEKEKQKKDSGENQINNYKKTMAT